MPSKLKTFLRVCVLVVLPTVLACLLVLEVGLRLVGRLPSNTTDGIFESHGTATYRLRKNMTKLSRTPSYTCTIHTNSLGFRDRAPGERTFGPEPYYAFVGDSLTFANGVDYPDSFVGVFGSLARRDGVDVVNLAVGGHRFSDQEEQLNDFLESVPKKPSKVVVVFTAQFVAGFEERFANLFVKNGYLFWKDSWVIPYITVTLGNTSSAYCFLRDGIRKAQNRLFPSAKRTAFELLQAYSREKSWAAPDVVERLEARLTALDARIRRGGAEPVYVYLPSSVDLRSGDFLKLTGQSADRYDFLLYSDLLRRHCETVGIPLVTLAPVLEKLHAEGKSMSFMQDMHYDADTNLAIGRALHEALIGSPASSSPRPP